MTLNAKAGTALALTLLLSPSRAAEKTPESGDNFAQQFKTIGFHLGGHTEFYDAIQTDSSGASRKFDPKPLIGFSTELGINERWRLGPELLWVLPQGSDGVQKNLFMVRLDGIWQAGEWWRLRGGTSLMVNNIRGSGGSVTLDNGGSTSEFYLPSESRTALNNTLDFGAEVEMMNFAVRLQTFLYAPFKNDRRQVSYSLILSYYHDLWK